MNVRSMRFRLTAWYAGILVISLTALCTAVYFGLSKYLTADLSAQLSGQANQIAGDWLSQVDYKGIQFAIHEIEEHVSPRITGHFLRLGRKGSGVLYESKPADEDNFTPSRLDESKWPSDGEFRRESGAGTKLLIYSLGYTSPAGQTYLIELGGSYAHIDGTLHGLLLIFAGILPLAIAAAVCGGFFLTRRSLGPVDQIIRATETITLRNLSDRLPVAKTGDEIERLSSTLNGMIARLEQSFRQITQFTADASHELRTPLTILRGEIEVALRNASAADDSREMLESFLEETERLSKLVESLMVLSRLDSGEAKAEYSDVDLSTLCCETVGQMHLLADDKSLILNCGCGEAVRVRADSLRIRQILINLVDNAIKYTPSGGTVNVRAYRENGLAIIEVQDTGAGIPAEALPHIFDRFYRVDKARGRETGGSGLGLAIAKSICDLHGANINVISKVGGGTEVKVSIPTAC